MVTTGNILKISNYYYLIEIYVTLNRFIFVIGWYHFYINHPASGKLTNINQQLCNLNYN